MQGFELFPDCHYPPVHSTEMNTEDLEKYARVVTVSREVRQMFRMLVQGLVAEEFEAQYMNICNLVSPLAWKMPEWCQVLQEFFYNLKEFLTTPFLIKESDGFVQQEYSTNLATVLSSSAVDHIHSLCPFHMEDNFTHCFMTMTSILTNFLHILPPYALFQKGICALFHDIGKGNTMCVTNKKNGVSIVGYPCHCLAGSIILRHLWGSHFTRWFDTNEWDLMCDTILYHMCGCNRDPDALCMTLLAHLPQNLLSELFALAQADVRGALPLQNFISNVPCLADNDEARNDLESNAEKSVSFEGLLSGKLFGTKSSPLKGVFIVLMGTSGCGKSHTIRLIQQTLVEKGVREELIHHLQRDEFIVKEGARLLGKDITDVSYSEAYNEITRVHEQDLLQGNEGIKSKISALMRDAANSYLLRGHIVLFDTMQTYFSGGRSSILPPAATNALRIYIYPVRTTLLTESDSSRHEMTMETQIRTCGPFSVLSPFSTSMKGTKHQATSLSQLKPVAAATTPSRVLYTQSPHYQVTLSSSVRKGQELPNNLLSYLLNKISLCRIFTMAFDEQHSADHTSATSRMNLAELMDMLETQFDQCSPSRDEATVAAARVAQIALFRKWFDDNQYTMTMPFFALYQRARYAYEMKVENHNEALALQSKIPSEYLPSAEDIASQSLHELTSTMKQLEALAYSCVMIKYKDGINRQWSAPWNIQSRSPICMFIQNHWRVISAMPRGPEVAGDQEHGVTALQDVDVDNEESFAHFAPHYQTIIKSLKGIHSNSNNASSSSSSSGSERGQDKPPFSKIVCSSKRDGMCFRVLCLLSSTSEGLYWQKAVKFISDPFVSLFVQTSRKFSRNPSVLLIPASNGTAFLTQKNIQYWMVCSMALSYGITHSQLLAAAANFLSPADVLKLPLPELFQNKTKYQQRKAGYLNATPVSPSAESATDAALEEDVSLIEAFVMDILDASTSASHPQHLSLNKMHTWEAIGGPHRMCAFDTAAHVELACSYSEDQCGISYLGYSITTLQGDLVWIPHFDIQHLFSEPVYWIMKSVSECIAALRDLSRVFGGSYTWDDFYSQYPPGNRNLAMTSHPDPEGFVSYFLMSSFKSQTPPQGQGQEKGEGEKEEDQEQHEEESYVYCKTKTWMYYVMHKIRIRDIPSILTMPEHFGQAFPSYYQVKSFFGEHGVANIIDMLTELCLFVRTNEELKADIPEKAAKALDRLSQSPEVIFKILLCNSRNVWRRGSVKIASKYFPEFQSLEAAVEGQGQGQGEVQSFQLQETEKETEEGALVLRALLMELKCYELDGIWQQNVRREFDFVKISETRHLSEVAGRLWSFIHSK